MNLSIPLAAFLVTSSVVLQGCVFSVGGNLGGEGGGGVTQLEGKADPCLKPPCAALVKKTTPKPIEQRPEKATAQCNEGKFSCDGNWKDWCAEQKKKCGVSCTPKCTWSCDSPKCDQVCAPKCGQALCSTRCKKFNTQSCEMKCGQPNCKIVCPKHNCPNQDCPACKTECGKPVCKMHCKKPDEQPCHHVCAQPQCKWQCEKPQLCPKPTCHMTCEKPRDCMENTRMVQQLPPLAPGETEVSAFGIAKQHAALLRVNGSDAAVHHHNHKSSLVRVDITTMGKDLSVQKSEADLKLASVAADDAAPTTWTRTISKLNDEITHEGEASCKSGRFHCQGDTAWCQLQKKTTVCGDEAPADDADDSVPEESRAAEDVVETEGTAGVDDHPYSEGREEEADVEPAFLQRKPSKQLRLQA